MMTFKEIKELIEIFDESNLTKLSIEENEFKIKLDKTSPVATTTVAPTIQPAPAQATTAPVAETPAPSAPTNDKNADYIKSPMVGTFYQAPAPDAAPYVKVGDKVKAGQTVCIVEAMKIMNEITAEFDCEILEILVEDGQAVEFDTPLFKVKKV
jgi:acetyl-CoA carboxylase biotin carboxyl carrier protein